MLISTYLFWKNVQVQKVITQSEVIEDFENLINPFCDQYHIITGTAKQEICKIMIEKFGKQLKHSDDWLRKRIDVKYKPMHRVKNAKKRNKESRLRKIPEKINKLERDFAELTKTTIDFAKRG